jgi:hypothetical protein
VAVRAARPGVDASASDGDERTVRREATSSVADRRVHTVADAGRKQNVGSLAVLLRWRRCGVWAEQLDQAVASVLPAPRP